MFPERCWGAKSWQLKLKNKVCHGVGDIVSGEHVCTVKNYPLFSPQYAQQDRGETLEHWVELGCVVFCNLFPFFVASSFGFADYVLYQTIFLSSIRISN